MEAEKNYTVMDEKAIRHCQEEDIASVTNLLSVSRASAIILLVHLKWCVDKVQDDWFADEEKVRKDIGLFEQPDGISVKTSQEITCAICFDAYQSENMFSSASCNHLFCKACWEGYIGTSINDGPGCLTLRCPAPSCNAAVGEGMVNALVCGESKEKYSRYLLRSYIEGTTKFKWCPAPGCGSVIQLEVDSETCVVTCKCTYRFCSSCIEEVHSPVDCRTVEKWKLKNSNESENMNWILANSKPCPKCQRPIEKNQGCMHMSCSEPCKYEFCWLCLGPWSEHGSELGAFYTCNRYEKAKRLGMYDEEMNKREKAKTYINKYAHYYERWVLNHKSKAQAVEELKKLQSVHIKNLSTKLEKTEIELEFISNAWIQIIECRHVLKWTYAYAYYLPENELAKKQFFEYLQGEAESGLERLHRCAENELELYINDKNPPEAFNGFRRKLEALTSVTGNYFVNLVRALENGLSVVLSNQKEVTPSKEKEGSKRRRKGKKNSNRRR